MTTRLLFLSSIFFYLTGCSSVPITKHEEPLFAEYLKITDAIELDKTKITDRDICQKLKKDRYDNGSLHLVTCTDTGYYRISFGFDPQTNIIFKKTLNIDSSWNIGVEYLKDKLHQKELTIRKAKWANPHAGPDYYFLENNNKSLSFVVSYERNEVESITWQEAGHRSITSEKAHASEEYTL